MLWKTGSYQNGIFKSMTDTIRYFIFSCGLLTKPIAQTTVFRVNRFPDGLALTIFFRQVFFQRIKLRLYFDIERTALAAGPGKTKGWIVQFA